MSLPIRTAGTCRHLHPVSGNMASLVADYGSDSDSDTSDTPARDSSVLVSATDGDKRQTNFFSSDAGADDDDQSASTVTQTDTASDQLPKPFTEVSKLPTPKFGKGGEESVFVTSYHLAEEAKQSVLEQHVKLSAAQQLNSKGDKKVCWNFKKGRCRFGSKCKYAHGDNISVTGNSSESVEKTLDTNTEVVNSGVAYPSMQGDFQGTPIVGQSTQVSQSHQQRNHNHRGPSWSEQNFLGGYDESQTTEDDDSYMAQAKRKKRAGVNDSLMPPKKAMSALDKQRRQERPWTYHR